MSKMAEDMRVAHCILKATLGTPYERFAREALETLVKRAKMDVDFRGPMLQRGEVATATRRNDGEREA